MYVEASLRVPVRECFGSGGAIDVAPYATPSPISHPPFTYIPADAFLCFPFSPPTSGEASSTSGGDAHTSRAQRRDPHTLPLARLPILGEATLPVLTLPVHTLPVHTPPVLTLPILKEAPRTKPSSRSRTELAGLRPAFCSRSFSAPPPSRSARMSSPFMITCRVKRWEDRGPNTKKEPPPPKKRRNPSPPTPSPPTPDPLSSFESVARTHHNATHTHTLLTLLTHYTHTRTLLTLLTH